MLVLTLTQPWATLIALGEKRVETRHWSPGAHNVGSQIAIRAGQGFGGLRGLGVPITKGGCAQVCARFPFIDVLYGRHGIGAPQARAGDAGRAIAHALPYGAVVAHATLLRVEPTGHMIEVIRHSRAGDLDSRFGEHELDFGGYGPGRFAWVLTGIHALAEPLPFSAGNGGDRGLRTLDESVAAEVIDRGVPIDQQEAA